MRKQFETRVRLVIYMDARDLHALAARAKREGRVLVGWARDVLMREVAPMPTFKHQPILDSSAALDPATVRNIHELGLPENDTRAMHTASSNRLTCMCATCSAYRHNHGIPLGGLPKKAKHQ
jgi:hypothetical protein